jgi:hypothetical protein
VRLDTFRALALVAPLVTLVACGNGAGVDDQAESGVRGVVTAGPQCPVVQQGSPCPDQPWQGAVRATTAGGDVVDEVRSDAGGRFEIALDPGDYVVVAVTDAGRLPMATPLEVMVPHGGWIEVTLVVDTGIR